MVVPILDPVPTGRPADWSFRRIQTLAKPVEVTRPPAWKNPNARLVATRDQAFRGTCVGQSSAYCFDILHLTLCPVDVPTDEDKVQVKRDVVDSLGTTHDILFPQSASAESFYQVSRIIGHVTYPAGSETRFAARAWIQYGANLESQWHTDKTGTKVWVTEPRQTTDGGLNPVDAATFASLHRAEGWAMLGDDAGTSNFDEICNAIYTKGFVLAGIPVYENYSAMEGGDGAFPEPRGEIAGYHALCFYGYDEDTLYLLHSWGSFCSTYGSVSKYYVNSTADQSVYLVVLDSKDVEIARQAYKSLTVTVRAKDTGLPILANITVNGVVVGIAPQKFATEPGKMYVITATCAGYQPQTDSVNDSVRDLTLILDPVPVIQKTWFQVLIEFIKRLLKWT